MCQDGGGEPVQLGGGGLARRGSVGFHADEDMAVWTDKTNGTVWTVHGCDDEPSPVTKGYAAGFAYPYVYVLALGPKGRPTGELKRVQVETGALESHSLPHRHLTRETLYAAGTDTFSASDGRSLTVYDAATWEPYEVPEPLPQGEAPSLSAGDGMVVYSVREEGSHQSLVYETRSRQARVRDGEAYAKGKWLLTRDDETYRLTSSS